MSHERRLMASFVGDSTEEHVQDSSACSISSEVHVESLKHSA